MIVPQGFQKMTDEELLKALIEDIGYDKNAAAFIVDVLRGRVESQVM